MNDHRFDFALELLEIERHARELAEAFEANGMTGQMETHIRNQLEAQANMLHSCFATLNDLSNLAHAVEQQTVTAGRGDTYQKLVPAHTVIAQ